MSKLQKLKNVVKMKMKKNDVAHDFKHIMRVYQNAIKIGKKENANMKILIPAVFLHDIVSFPKFDKRTKSSSSKSAFYSKKILKKLGYSNNEIKIISAAIRDHSFSKNKISGSLEGKILQDADRLDAIGAIGIARVFATAGANKRPLYHENDPFSSSRALDDKKWALDHFYKKLLILERKMNTDSGKIEARRRTKLLKKFLHDFKKEIQP